MQGQVQSITWTKLDNLKVRLFICLKELKRKERHSVIITFTSLLTKWLQRPGWFSSHCCRSLNTWTVFCCFSQAFSGNWIKSGVARIQASTLTGCQHCRQCINSLYHNANPISHFCPIGDRGDLSYRKGLLWIMCSLFQKSSLLLIFLSLHVRIGIWFETANEKWQFAAQNENWAGNVWSSRITLLLRRITSMNFLSRETNVFFFFC